MKFFCPQRKNIFKTWIPFILAILFVFGSIGLFFSMWGVEEGGQMLGCPQEGRMESWCPMNTLDHLSLWKSVFSVTLPSSDFLFLLMTFIMTFFSFHFFKEILKRILHDPPFLFLRLESILLGIFLPLELGFQRGILHPKKDA